jgi:alkanesulfonate monooxygenase SsuD/methylene tetrahydromethanopterin reductase-like flavin-dependent oxidoreductase (luciferase family)
LSRRFGLEDSSLKILFDQNVPRPLAHFLINHQVIRAAELGWSELKNGDLLRAAEDSGFDLMVTADRNLSYQQNLSSRKLAILVLPSGQWPEVLPHLALVVEATDNAKPGSFVDLLALRSGNKGSPPHE